MAFPQVDQFKTWYEKRHDYAKDYKAKTGKKVVGYFCTYVPEEILYAADILPTRILGSHEPQDVTEPYIFGMFCPFCRDCLAQGLKGRFNYLDGITIAQSCLHIRQAFTNWKKYVPVDWAYYLVMPHHVQNPRSKTMLAAEYVKYKQSIEDWLGKKIPNDAIENAVEVYNTNRRLMKQVYETRKADKPAITGLEAMYMVVSGQIVDKAEHNKALEALLEALPGRKVERETGTRLIIVGSEDDDTEFIKMVESVGATIVADDHCTGTRYFWDEVQPNGDVLNSLATRYCDRTPCPTKDWPKRSRFPKVLNFAQEWGAQGAIVVQQKFCDPHETDIPPLMWYLKDNGIPSLFLEFDVTVPIGQFRTRVEAFLETMSEEDLF